MNDKTDLIEYLLRLGDSALIQGQRLCQWCGKAPALEEELALMNVGLDLVGQARHWLEYAAELLDDGRDADDLAFRRDERAYRNLLLVEQPNGDYAVTMLKQFLYDAWHLPVLQGLSQSSDERIAGIAAKAAKEVTYHLRRSGEWIERLGDGTEESHRRMLAAIPEVWRFTVELIAADDSEQRLCAAGISRHRQRRWAMANHGQRGIRPRHPARPGGAELLLSECPSRSAQRTLGHFARRNAVPATSVSRCNLVS